MNPIPGRIMQVDPEHAGRVVGEIAEQLGLPRADSYTPAEAADCAHRMEYACTPAAVAEFVRKRYISDPGEVWEPVHVYCLLGALESRRRWQPTPCKHDLKKSGVRLEVERLRAQGVNEPIAELDRASIEDLLLQLVQCDYRATRECLYEALNLKLAGFEE